MRRQLIIILFLLPVISITAGVKKIEKVFKTKDSQVISLSGFSGSKIKIYSWDRDEVAVKLRVEFNSTKEEYEANYLKSADVVAEQNESMLKLVYKTIGEEGKWSHFLGIKYNFMYSQWGDVGGVIYIPKKNSFKTNVQYSNISLDNMMGVVELNGKSNDIEIKNCSHINTINNDYGKIKITNCSGDLRLNCRSGNIEVSNLTGSLNIDGNYSTINLNDISKSVVVRSKSGTHIINGVGGNLSVISDYSNIIIDNVKGYVSLKDASGTVSIKRSEGLKLDANYSTINISDVTVKQGNNITIAGRSGRLLMENITGDILVSNPYSEMEFRKIKGDINVAGMSSTIVADQITGNWSSGSSYVKMILHNMASRNIKISNRSESVDIDCVAAPKEVDIKNEYGSVSIKMPAGFTGDVDMVSRFGQIRSNLPLSYETKSSNVKATAKIGTGHGQFKVETRSGDIDIYQK